MWLNKLYNSLAVLLMAGAIQLSSATPLNSNLEPVRGDAETPTAFYYDPVHLLALQDIVTPKLGECNMLLSVKNKGDQVCQRPSFEKPIQN